MIVVDANYFLRLLTAPDPTIDPALFVRAEALFRAADLGLLEFTTSEAVIAEVVFVLGKRYHQDRSAIATGLVGILELPGCRMPTRRGCVLALGFWTSHRSLDFVEALLSVLAEQSGAQLATLDDDLARLTEATVWTPVLD